MDLQKVTYFEGGSNEITGAYTSDLLSDVIAHSQKGFIWVTLQTHVNIVAVASLKELVAIIIVLNKEVDSDTIEKANSEKIIILKTSMNAYEVSGKLYELGIR
ncbi:MAG: serine kinase [Ignavibacteria bacterium]